MRYRWYVLLGVLGAMLLSMPLFAEGTTEPGMVEPGQEDDPGMTENCWVCRIIDFGDGDYVVACGKPASGGWGTKQCEVQTYPEGAYCISYGESCCVN